MDPYFISSIADWLINLSAGWFAAVFIAPVAGKRSTKLIVRLLTGNMLLAILSLIIAIQLRKDLGLL